MARPSFTLWTLVQPSQSCFCLWRHDLQTASTVVHAVELSWVELCRYKQALTFQPDLDYSPDTGTGLLSPISYALQRGILLRRENPTYRYRAPVAAATRDFKMVLFTASRGNTFVGGTCALPSALLVDYVFIQPSCSLYKSPHETIPYSFFYFFYFNCDIGYN